MATFNSQTRRRVKRRLVTTVFIFAGAGILLAGEDQNKKFAARAESEFLRTQIRFQSAANNPTNAWQFACACYDFADFATNDTERATIAVQGIAACRQIIVREPKSAPAHYYLAMNLGQLARTELLGALKLVKEMEREFKTADGLDEHFDYAGTARNLGLLYGGAPGWPASIGSKRKARDWLERAVKLAPDYPENHLNLLESFLQWHEINAAKLESNALDSLWPKAQKNFSGVDWERSWDDWTKRRAAVRTELNLQIPDKTTH
jgi:tetratricopeptide (TPR) repeat protein